MYTSLVSISENRDFAETIGKSLDEKLPIRLGVNKKNELIRLIYEVSRTHDLTFPDIIERAGIDQCIEDGKGKLFERTKKALLGIRYPSMASGDDPHIMPIKTGSLRTECTTWDSKLTPSTIFIEKAVQEEEWTQDFLRNFPEAECVQVQKADEGLNLKKASEMNQTELYNARRENIFLVKNKTAFLKKCPCTKDCQRCGYWILNIGFGCPIDCTYCYLQNYSNAPGLILTANIEDYYEHIEEFDKKISKRTRIGTGEFTDSLALDRYTGYSSRLIPFFRNTKNLIFELKTKVSDIDNVLKEEPHENVVISWSMNTNSMAERYEKGGASISERINAAKEASKRGYKIGFHFDPIVYYAGWEDDYKDVIGQMFTHDSIRQNTVWISLGSLRYTPGLKQIAEERFADNLMFYEGEFFTDDDGKLRYPRELRIEMYNKIVGWIRSFNVSSWVYLCMEPEEVWQATSQAKDMRIYSE